MNWDVTAEPVQSTFEFDDDTLVVSQVKLTIFGNEYFIDPDQASNLVSQLLYALGEIGE